MNAGISVGLVVVGLSVRVALYLIRQKNIRNGNAPSAPMPDDPRWGASRVRQVTGRRCGECGLKIAVAGDGRFCKKCDAPVHQKACAKRHRLLAHPLTTNAGPYR